MKYLSLFSGIGGFELGIDKKAECIGFSEIDKYAIQIYKKHFPNHNNYGDITKINEKELPDFDLIVGGFPCQSFSVAGKRGGFNDTRGTLFFDIARIIGEKQPRLLLLENVKGLLSHDKGYTFRAIISTLDELGYDLQWQVLNSKNHGVPQNRERVFIVGHLRGTSRPEVFPIETKTTTTTSNKANKQQFIAPVLTPDRTKKRQNGRRFKENGDPSFTLTAQDKHGVYNGTGIRKLTPIECERLQGFPDNWTEGISDTQRYKCLGNAVTTNVVKTIINQIICTT